ncbi:MAG: aminotransferase class IV, partial [Candidatus Acidiferrales bacterium]
MSLKKTEKIWYNGKLINWDDAQIHVVSHVVSYGSAVFEGIRCYKTPQGSAIFRLREHMERLRNSAHIYRMDFPFSIDETCHAALDLVRANHMDACYIRPI